MDVLSPSSSSSLGFLWSPPWLPMVAALASYALASYGLLALLACSACLQCLFAVLACIACLQCLLCFAVSGPRAGFMALMFAFFCLRGTRPAKQPTSKNHEQPLGFCGSQAIGKFFAHTVKENTFKAAAART